MRVAGDVIGVRVSSAISGVALVAALAACGCGEAPPSSSEDQVSVVKNELVTSLGGSAYAQQCANDGVPLPQPWGTTTVGPGKYWTDNGMFDENQSFQFDPAEVFFHVSSTPPGICVIAAHTDDAFDVICQGSATGKACFWEGPQISTPPSPPLVIATTGQYSGPISGGTQLATHCTVCHAGENVFIAHQGAHDALDLNGTAGWMPSGYYDPIEPAGWPNAAPSTTNYPASCTTGCHVAGGIAGRFPALETAQFSGSAYCRILRTVTNRPGSQGGMPPTSVCDPDPNNGMPCASESDPAVRAMLAACGAPNPPVPLSIGGISPPGIGSQFMATRRHVSQSAPGEHQHYFYGATTTMPNAGCCAGQTTHPALQPNDKIEVSVYLPADDKPREVMLQVWNGANWYRAFWGQDLIAWSPRTFKGLIPNAGSWTVLSFTPADLGMTGTNVLSGMAFTLFDGSASWSDVLFRSSDSPLNGQYVSEVWVGDRVPPGATQVADNGDAWAWSPDDMTQTGNGSYMSSSPFNAGPNLGNDRNTDGNFFDGSVFHTGNTVDSTSLGLGTGGEWWWTDMGSMKTVRQVVLHNRTDCCQDRLSHFRINYWDGVNSRWLLASDQSNTLTTAANPVITINLPTPVNARYIMVQKADHNYLHLAEVEIFGDP
jgi:hypothetical protein